MGPRLHPARVHTSVFAFRAYPEELGGFAEEPPGEVLPLREGAEGPEPPVVVVNLTCQSPSSIYQPYPAHLQHGKSLAAVHDARVQRPGERPRHELRQPLCGAGVVVWEGRMI